MKVICAEDEQYQLDYLIKTIKTLPFIKEVTGFKTAGEVLNAVNLNRYDAAILDIHLPDMNGLELATQIKSCSPGTAIIFATANAQYAIKAFKLRASGYLLKPVSRDDLLEELSYARHTPIMIPDHGIYARTFGNFDLYVDGELATFHRQKSKEVLAYLIDRRGFAVRRSEIASVLWENEPYDRSHQKQLDVFIRDLQNDLRQYGISDLLEINRTIRVKTEKLDSDLFRFLSRDVDAVNSFIGEYMSSYSWAESSAADLFFRNSK